jgi:hypothetical protein
LFEFGRIGRSTNAATETASVQSGRPFFSRRLGLSPTGEPVALEYGGKLSGRVGRFSIGTLAVHQDEFVQNAGTPSQEVIEDETLLIGRIAADVLGESTLGMIFTDGDPISNVDNSLLGVDFQYLNTRLPGGRTLEAEAWFQQTDTPGLDGDDHAHGFGISVPNAEGWRGGVSLKELGLNYRPALGFVSRTGVRDYLAQVGYTHFVAGGDFLQTLSAGVDAERVNFIARNAGVEAARPREPHERLLPPRLQEQQGVRRPAVHDLLGSHPAAARADLGRTLRVRRGRVRPRLGPAAQSVRERRLSTRRLLRRRAHERLG